MEKKLYVIIRTIDESDYMYHNVCGVFEGLRGYCEGNTQAVIDYMADWDGEQSEDDFCEEEPYLGRGTDDSYADENGVYTLLYNPVIGGVFMLYREATEEEYEWWKELNEE